MNRKHYDKAMYNILKDNNKFTKPKSNPTLLKEEPVKRSVRTFKKEGVT